MKRTILSLFSLLMFLCVLQAEEFLVYHVTSDVEVARAKFNKIDFQFIEADNNRFGRALYVSKDLETAKQEVIQNGGAPKAYIIYKVNPDKPMMDFTQEKIRKTWDYENLLGIAGHAPILGVMARGFGYMAIRFNSTKHAGGVNFAIFEESLHTLTAVELVEINE